MATPVVDDTKKQIVLDLTQTSAGVIRAGNAVTITKIRVNGLTGAGDGSITLRKNTANGPVVYTLRAPATTDISDNADFEGLAQVAGSGLYFDALGTVWAAGSRMILYVTRGF